MPIGSVDSRIFGGFLEHLGRCVYEGVYQPDSPHADGDGFCRDVLEALRGLHMPVMRYPGGNFASGYHWRKGVGPRERRSAVIDLAWNSRDTNAFGTGEFIALCRKMAWAPMLTVNLGTGSPEEAGQWVEYCNRPVGTEFADLRVAHGSPEPFGVKLWCLGNEMEGGWQLGHVPADHYALRAQQAAKIMKDVDPEIELTVCGQHAAWADAVLQPMGDLADYVSVHRYVDNREGDTVDFLAVTNSIDEQIEQADATCRHVQAQRSGGRRAYISFDEWNVWYKNTISNGQGTEAPYLLEEVYNLEDALVVAGFLNCFIRHADSVKIANIAQIVNVIAPIMTHGDEMLIQSIYWPFAMYTRRRNGLALRTVDGPTYEAPTYGTTGSIDASVIIDRDQLHVFLVNRSLDVPAQVTIAPADRPIASFEEAEVLTGPDAKAANSFEQPDVIRSERFDAVTVKDGQALIELPSLSVVAMMVLLGSRSSRGLPC